VNDGDPGDVEAVVADSAASPELRVLRQEHGGPGLARNTGAAEARGRWLAFTDDDCLPAVDWIRRLRARLEKSPEDGVGGSVVNAFANNVFSTASQVVLDSAYDLQNTDPDEATFLATANLALPADRFREIGGFAAVFSSVASEDRDICDRWRASGGRLVYAPECVVTHSRHLGLASFCRQHFRYGRGACLLYRARASRGGPPLRASWTFLKDLAGRPFRERRRLAPVVALLALLSQAASAAGYFREKLRRREVAR
jgi:GT2 family glycosyltransferase